MENNSKNKNFFKTLVGTFFFLIVVAVFTAKGSGSNLPTKTRASTSSTELSSVPKTEPKNSEGDEKDLTQKNIATSTGNKTAPEKKYSTQISTSTVLEKNESSPDYFIVTNVVDGDTIDILQNNQKTRLRLIGIDTPETKDPRKPVQCFGKEASLKAAELLLNQKIRLEFEPGQSIDKYGRTLAYVYRADGLFYNKWMIENGYAHEYTYKLPYTYQTEFKAAQKQAEENRLGLWNPNTCGGKNFLPAIEATSTAPEMTPLETSVLTPTTTTKTDSSSTPSHIWYLSTLKSAAYYYCDSDEAWKSLSKKYLAEFHSEAKLLKSYPNRKLHKACR
jgi:micrococcal nuclease